MGSGRRRAAGGGLPPGGVCGLSRQQCDRRGGRGPGGAAAAGGERLLRQLGAGKSSLLNLLEPSLALKTGETSKKLGRGRHTTRHVELYPVGGGFLADTPGFSSVELEKFAVIRKEELAGCFREFQPYVDQCRFGDCSHTGEKGCAVVEAVQRGEIARSRFESYCILYEDAKKLNDWELPGYRQKG